MYAILGLQDDVVNQFCEDYQGPGIVMGANYNSRDKLSSLVTLKPLIP